MNVNVFEESTIHNRRLPDEWQSQDCLNELEDIGLIFKIQTKGKPSKIYVKNFNRMCRFQLIG